jgi:TPR repeat protein
MTAILSVLAVLLSAIWYYQTAASRDQPAMAWAMAGALLYYGGFLLWMHVVLKSLMSSHFLTHSFWAGIAMDISSILFGAGCMAVFRWRVLARKG